MLQMYENRHIRWQTKVHEASSDSAPHKMLCKAASLDATLTIANALLFSNIERARQFALDFFFSRSVKMFIWKLKKEAAIFWLNYTAAHSQSVQPHFRDRIRTTSAVPHAFFLQCGWGLTCCSGVVGILFRLVHRNMKLRVLEILVKAHFCSHIQFQAKIHSQ